MCSGFGFFVYFQGSIDTYNNHASTGALREQAAGSPATLAVKLCLEKSKGIKK